MSRKRVWVWPTEGAWVFFGALVLVGALSTGWRGAAIAAAFGVYINVSGNLMLPEYRDEERE